LLDLVIEDGTTVEGDLNLARVDLQAGLPAGLRAGSLCIWSSQCSEGGSGIQIDGDVMIQGGEFEKLPSNFSCGGNMRLALDAPTAFGENTHVDGYLKVERGCLTSLDGATVDGEIVTDGVPLRVVSSAPRI
jgi:hypothetical protein